MWPPDVQQLSQFSDDLARELGTPISKLMGKSQVTAQYLWEPGLNLGAG